MLLLQTLLLREAIVCIISRHHPREDPHQAYRLQQAVTLFRKVNRNQFRHRRLQRSLKGHQPKSLENHRAAFLRNFQCPLNPDSPRGILAQFPRPHRELMAHQVPHFLHHQVEVDRHMLRHLYNNTLFSLRLHIRAWSHQKE